MHSIHLRSVVIVEHGRLLFINTRLTLGKGSFNLGLLLCSNVASAVHPRSIVLQLVVLRRAVDLQTEIVSAVHEAIAGLLNLIVVEWAALLHGRYHWRLRVHHFFEFVSIRHLSGAERERPYRLRRCR